MFAVARLGASGGGTVAAIEAVQPTGLPPTWKVVDASAYPAVAPGWLLNPDGTLSAPPTSSPSLPQAQATQVGNLRLACATTIGAGFASSALGAAHHYPSGTTDQLNLIASVAASSLPGVGNDWSTPFWCADAAGTWSFASHNAAQIQQVGIDGKAMVVGAQLRLATLTANVAAATTVAAVQAITWA